MTAKDQPAETTVETKQVASTKRQITATVASTAVTVVLGLAANLAIAKVAAKVHTTIVPEDQMPEE